MPNIKSAIKRVSVNNRQKEENRGQKSELASAVKKFKALVDAKDLDAATKLYADTVSTIDAACSKGLITKNNASRKKSRLAIMLNTISK